MKITQGQEQRPATWAGITNPCAMNLNGSLASLGPPRRNQPFLPARGTNRSGSDLNPTIGSSLISESRPCSEVIEERNRLAREIHDTLAQDVAGILLHLEAANGSNGAVNASECLTRARELARCGLEDARRMLLALRPKSLEGAHLSDALSQLAERFSCDCGIHCTFRATGRRSHNLP